MSDNPEQAGYRGPLADLRILDFTRVLAGPFATSMLSDLGATVVKVEDPKIGDISREAPPIVNGISSHFVNLNRGKQSIAVDLKTPEGRVLALDLARECDVVVENFRPGVMKRLGLDFESVKAVNPGIIYCSVSGFGQDSSYRDKPSFDVITQAMSGAMSVTGEPGRPPVRLGIPMGDLSGGIYAVFGVLAALHERTVTGHGQYIDVSMLDGLAHLMLYYPLDFLNLGVVAKPVGGRHEHAAPYGVFEVSDGHLVLSMFGAKFWQLYCEAIDRTELVDDERFRSAGRRLRNRVELYGILDELMKNRTVAEWGALFDEYGIPWAPVLTSDQMATHPLMAERKMFTALDQPGHGQIHVTGRPLKFPSRPDRPLEPAPALGEHTFEVLSRLLGVDPVKLAELQQRSVIDQHRPDTEQVTQ